MSNFVTMDGNAAAANVAYDFTEIAAIYPITPSSPMAGLTDQWSANGRLNMFNQPVKLIEMQSEAGAIGAVHGALQTGSLGVSYTSSQGLMLMVPVLYRIAGERLPAVLHVAARTVGTHGMSIFVIIQTLWLAEQQALQCFVPALFRRRQTLRQLHTLQQ